MSDQIDATASADGFGSAVHALLRRHRSIRKFTDEPVPHEVVAEIVRSGLCAATSSNLQATTVIEVTRPEVRSRIAAIAGGQRQIETAGAFLVWCADLDRTRRACEIGGSTMVTGMTEQFIIATVDVALAAQNAVVSAEAMGYGICYIGAVRNDPRSVSELLELPDQVYPVFGLCIGVPAQDPETKPRLPIEVVLKTDMYDASAEADQLADYDETLRAYYRTRTGGTKESSWTEEMARLVEGERRPHMRQFLADRGFEMR